MDAALPGPVAFTVGAFCFMCGLGLDLFTVTRLLRDGRDIFYVLPLLVGTFLPGVLQSTQLWLLFGRVMQKSLSSYALEMVYSFFQVNRVVESYRYLVKGKQPNWMLVMLDRHGTLSSGGLINVAANLILVLDGNSSFNVLASLAAKLLSFPLVPMIDHKMNGSPTQMDKYRIWDWEGSPQKTAIAVFLIDWTQVTYRLMGYALIWALAGLGLFAAHISFYICLIMIYNFRSFRIMKAFRSVPLHTSIFSVWAAAIVDIVHDMGWLEPWAAHFYLRFCYPLRVCELAAICLTISLHWDAHPEYAQEKLLIMLIYFIANAALWLILHYWYVYVDRWEAWQESGRKADVFYAGQLDILESNITEKVSIVEV
jgi:hypothetical protein